MSGPLDDFLKQVVDDCVNGSSGEWLRPGDTLAAYYRQALADGDWRGSTEVCCKSCERPHPYLEDGWCPQCNALTPEDLVERQHEAAARGRALTVRLLRRMGYPDRAKIHEKEPK